MGRRFVVDVFEQVEEELRSDRYKRLFRTWGPVVGGVLVIALVAALGWWGWDSWQTSRAAKGSVAYARGIEALQAGNAAGARAAFVEAAEQGNGAYKALSLNQQAGLALSESKDQEAIRLFDEAAKAAGDPLLADVARLKAAWILMDQPNAPLADIEARLNPLAEEKRPLRPFAQQAIAMARLANGKPAEARAALVQLTLGQDVPDVVRQTSQTAIDAIDSGILGNLNDILTAQRNLPTPAAPVAPPAMAAPAQ